MIYILLSLIYLIVWLPLRRPTIRWEMFIYGQPIMYRHLHVDPEERRWAALREEWHRRDVT